MLGVSWPQMRAAIDAPLAGLGALIAAFTAAYFVSTASSGPLSNRLGTARLASLSAFTAGVGLVALASVTSWPLTVAGALLLGLGSGAVDAGINAYVALAGGVRSMGVLHASWAVGAAVGPALVGAGEAAGSWRLSYLVAAVAYAAIALALLTLAPVARVARATEAREAPRSGRRAHVAIGAAMFFVYVGLESAVGQWAFVDLAELRGITAVAAGWGVSLFFAALAAGRVALGVGGHRVPLRLELDASVALTLAGAAGYWLLPAPLAALVALPLLGLGLSVFIPVLLALTPERMGREATANAVGVQFAAGTVGGGGIPAALGAAMQGVAMPVLGAAATLLAGALAALHAVARGR